MANYFFPEVKVRVGKYEIYENFPANRSEVTIQVTTDSDVEATLGLEQSGEIRLSSTVPPKSTKAIAFPALPYSKIVLEVVGGQGECRYIIGVPSKEEKK